MATTNKAGAQFTAYIPPETLEALKKRAKQEHRSVNAQLVFFIAKGLQEEANMFDQFVNNVKLQVKPEGRALHTASTLDQLFTIMPESVSLADLACGWEALAASRQENEEGPVAGRRATCRELASIARNLTSEPGDINQACAAWDVWASSFVGNSDPRQAAMGQTFIREVQELKGEQ